MRRAIKQQRHALATGELTIADVMLKSAAALGDRTLFEIVLMARGIGRTRLAELNTRDRRRRQPRGHARVRRRVHAPLGRSQRAAPLPAQRVRSPHALTPPRAPRRAAAKDRPGGVTRTEVSDMFSRNKKRREIERALTVLEDAGRLRRETRQPDRGRHAEVWIPITAEAA